MNNTTWKNFLKEEIKKIYVHGYIKPEKAFHTLKEWEELFVNEILRYQKQGTYISHSHGELVGPDELLKLIDDFYGFQLTVDVNRYDLLTTKNILAASQDG